MTGANGPVLCRFDELADPDARAFTIERDGRPLDIILVRTGDRVSAFVNRCPHAGSPLDWMPGQFLNLDRTHLQCATHDALFTLEAGECVAGPCVGDALEPVPVVIDGGEVRLRDPAS